MHLRPSLDRTLAAVAALALLLPAAALAQPFPIRPIPIGKPDLVVTSLVLSCPTTSACGTQMVQVGCPNNCMATATVRNNGPVGVPGNTTHLRWTTINIYGAPTNETQTIVPPIPAGGQVTVTRPYYFGPCTSCTGAQIGSFTGFVDPNNTVNESNETNNSLTVPACQVCNGGT